LPYYLFYRCIYTLPEKVNNMKFGGIQKTSLIDYPGKIGCTLFTIGCNFACPYCHNAELITGKTTSSISETDIFSFLEQRRDLLDAVIVTGGEPTLHKQLANFLHRIKMMGFCIKLDTNGSHPAMLQELMEQNLLDYIALDLKTLPTAYGRYLKASSATGDQLMESIRLIMHSGIPAEFRTTCVKPLVSRTMIHTFGESIKGALLWAFQRCNPSHVLDPAFFEAHNRLFEEEELDEFRAIASEYVQTALIR
jgi:pyruvate formate lyase activating enzyme